MNNRNLARALRLATVQGQFMAGNLTEDEAKTILKGPLVPGDDTTISDDSHMVHFSHDQIKAALDVFPVADIVALALDQIKTSRPSDRSERDRYYAIVITDLEKVLAYARTYLK